MLSAVVCTRTCTSTSSLLVLVVYYGSLSYRTVPYSTMNDAPIHLVQFVLVRKTTTSRLLTSSRLENETFFMVTYGRLSYVRYGTFNVLVETGCFYSPSTNLTYLTLRTRTRTRNRTRTGRRFLNNNYF